MNFVVVRKLWIVACIQFLNILICYNYEMHLHATAGIERPTASKAARKLLELRPLRSQSDVHRFIERVITEDSLDLTDIYVGYGSSSFDESSAQSVPLKTGDLSVLNTGQCKLEVTGLPAEIIDVSTRQTLQEIDPNKQPTGLGQSTIVTRHSEELSINASAVVCSGENNVNEIDACAEVKSEAAIEELDASVSGQSAILMKHCSKPEEINNNRRFMSLSNMQPRHVDGPKFAPRKSKRCNRGQRYKELVSQGILHQPRRRQDIR